MGHLPHLVYQNKIVLISKWSILNSSDSIPKRMQISPLGVNKNSLIPLLCKPQICT